MAAYIYITPQHLIKHRDCRAGRQIRFQDKDFLFRDTWCISDNGFMKVIEILISPAFSTLEMEIFHAPGERFAFGARKRGRGILGVFPVLFFAASGGKKPPGAEKDQFIRC